MLLYIMGTGAGNWMLVAGWEKAMRRQLQQDTSSRRDKLCAGGG